ncbi:MAG: hypothetical protein HQL59_13290, partial [Magnetococcales bacterium]|nr:hypothetical protein [Magnetococcales bacterium]
MAGKKKKSSPQVEAPPVEQVVADGEGGTLEAFLREELGDSGGGSSPPSVSVAGGEGL